MNEYEISKLKKELQRKAQLLKQQREDREFIQKQLIQAQAQRDKYKSQLLIAKQTIQNIDIIIAANVKEMKAKLQEENAEALQQLKKLKDRVIEEKRLNEKLLEENKTKQTVISQLSLKIRQISRNYKDPSLIVNTKEITEQAILSHNRFYKLTEKHNKLCADMDNILAENKILRKLHGVPDNFGFDLEQIKIAQKQELQDYKSQCRKLQNQIEQLQAQRTQLRYRLRQYNTLYSNKGQRYKDLTQQQLERLDEYALNLKEGKIQFPQIDKTQKQMERQILKLRAQVQVLQAKQPFIMPGKGFLPGQSVKGGQKLNSDEMKRLQQQIKSILDPFVNNIKSINETNVNNLIQILQKLQQGGQGLPLVAGDQGVIGPGFRPPIPLPHAYNDWSIIKEGYSYKYSCKIPISMGELQSDLGFDVIKAKYQIAALQLHNIESLKLLKQKNKVQEQISKQLEDLKSKYKKCLKVQDQLFLNYFKEKQTTRETYRKLEIEHQNIKTQRDQLQARLDIVTDAFNTLSKSTDVQKKLSLFATRLATSQPQVIRLERKYKTLNDEMKIVKDSYTRLQGKSAQAEYALKQKLLIARKNESLLTSYLNQILDENKQSVSSDVHNSLRIRTQTLNDKLANFVSKQAQLRIKISRLESIQREMNIKDDIIDSLREDNMDLSLQMQILKNRLYCIDSSYRRFTDIFKDLITFVNTNNISLLTYFKKFDRDNSGTLTRDQMHNALNTLGFKLKRQETQILYSQFDLDGSNQITYREFNRKLKRGGALSRSKQQEALFKLFKAIKQCNLTIKDAFQVIDVDGNNSVTKSQFQSALRKIGIEVHSSTIDYIFKMVDTDMSGTISCVQLQQIFHDVVKQTIIQEKEVYNVELDWKYAVIIKIDEMSSKFNTSLHETFKKLDSDHNACLTRTEMMQFFKMCNIDIPKKDLQDFFNMLDKTRDGKIQYNEFLRVLAQAKKQKARIQRIKFIQKRAEQIKKENQINKKQVEQFKISQEAGLKVRMQALQTKHSNLIKKNDKLCKNLVSKQQEIYDLNQQILETEKSIDKLNREYFKQKQANIILREKMKNYIGQEKAKELSGNINKSKIINTQLKAQLDRYKGLFQGLSTRNRADELKLGKIEAQKNKYYDLVKDLQSKTDLNAQLAKKTIELQHSKYNEELINKKYDQIIDDLRKIADENKTIKQQLNDKQIDFVNTHIFMKEKYNLQQRAMDQLSAKVFPTFTISKLDMFIVKLRQISGSKSQLQLQNQALREKNFALQLRNDYIQNQKVHLQELQRKLRRNYTDQSSVTIIDLTKKLSQYKMSELKSKRQCNLLKQKQDYYMRVNHTYADNVKELQQQIGKWEIKHNEREQFWKKKIADQVKLMEDLRNQTQKAKQQEKKAVLFFKNKQIDAEKIDKQFEELGQARRERLSTIIMQPGSNNTQQLINYQNQLLDLRNELIEKQKEIYKYKTALQEIIPEAQTRFTNFGSQIGAPTNSFVMQTDLTTSQLKNNARRFLQSQKQTQQFYKDESEKMAYAAQQSIDTLQRIIDDKNDQLKRKEKIIEDLRRDFIKNKEQDCIQIQKLNQQIRELRSKTQLASLNEMINKPTSKNFYPKTSDKINDLLKVIDEKDDQIKEWQKKYDKLFLSKAKSSGANTSGQVEKSIQTKYKKLLKQRLDEQQQKQQQMQNSYKQRIKKLDQMLKMKQKKLTTLSNTINDLKDQCLKLSEEESFESALGRIQKMVTGSNVNEGKLQIMLQNALEQLSSKNKKQKQMAQQLKNVARLNSTKKR